jgi:hypothetical protein
VGKLKVILIKYVVVVSIELTRLGLEFESFKFKEVRFQFDFFNRVNDLFFQFEEVRV